MTRCSCRAMAAVSRPHSGWLRPISCIASGASKPSSPVSTTACAPSRALSSASMERSMPGSNKRPRSRCSRISSILPPATSWRPTDLAGYWAFFLHALLDAFLSGVVLGGGGFLGLGLFEHRLLALLERRGDFLEEPADARGVGAEIVHTIARYRPDIDLGAGVVALDLHDHVVGKAQYQGPVGRLDAADAGLARSFARHDGPASPLHGLLHQAENFGGGAFQNHRAKIRIGVDLLFDRGRVGILDRIGVGGTLAEKDIEGERLVGTRGDIVQAWEKRRLGDKERGRGEAEQGDHDRGEGLAGAGLSAEPDADERNDGDGDGEEEPGERHPHQVQRHGRRQQGEAVQKHRQDEELHEEKGDAPRPSGFMRLLDGEPRRRVARHRIVHVAALAPGLPGRNVSSPLYKLLQGHGRFVVAFWPSLKDRAGFWSRAPSRWRGGTRSGRAGGTARSAKTRSRVE